MKDSRQVVKSGFTLVELLVVIAIIAMLLSIVLPSLRAVRQRAQEMVCRTNLRSLVLGVRMYAETHDGDLFGYWASGAYSGDLYLSQLAQQIGDVDQVRYCPETTIDETRTSASRGNARQPWSWVLDGRVEYGSYGMNGWLYSYPQHLSWIESEANLQRFAYPTTTAARSPHNVPVFSDANWVDAWPKDTDTVPIALDLDEGGFGADGPVTNHMRRLILNRHRGTVGIAFLDGRVSSVELERLWSYRWHREFVTRGEEMTRTDGSPIYRR